MVEEIEFRQYNESDKQEILDLLGLSFPDWAARKSPKDYWNWKYQSCPYGSVVHVASKAGKIVSVRHGISLPLKIGGTTYSSLYWDDVATAPKMRGQGIFDKLLDAEIDYQKKYGIRAAYSVPIHPATARLLNPSQKFVPHGIKHLVRVRDLGLFVENMNLASPKIAELGITLVKALSKTKTSLTRESGKKEINIKDSTQFPEKVDDIWEANQVDLNLSLERKSRFLNWRYCDPRGGSFIIKHAFDSDILLGYAVAEVRGEGTKTEAYIMDIQTLSRRGDVADMLLGSLVAAIDDRGINAMHFRSIDGHPLQRHVKSRGFMVLPGQKKMLLKISLISTPIELFKVVEKSPPSKLQFGYGDFF